MPGVGKRLKSLLQQANQPLKKVFWHENLSRAGLQKILHHASFPQKEEFVKLAQADIFWDEVVATRMKKNDYEFVYDLTVKDAHNFVVDGVLVHNTAMLSDNPP